MDGCSRQNPAYRPAKGKARSGGSFLCDEFCGSRLSCRKAARHAICMQPLGAGARPLAGSGPHRSAKVAARTANAQAVAEQHGIELVSQLSGVGYRRTCDRGSCRPHHLSISPRAIGWLLSRSKPHSSRHALPLTRARRWRSSRALSLIWESERALCGSRLQISSTHGTDGSLAYAASAERTAPNVHIAARSTTSRSSWRTPTGSKRSSRRGPSPARRRPADRTGPSRQGTAPTPVTTAAAARRRAVTAARRAGARAGPSLPRTAGWAASGVHHRPLRRTGGHREHVTAHTVRHTAVTWRASTPGLSPRLEVTPTFPLSAGTRTSRAKGCVQPPSCSSPAGTQRSNATALGGMSSRVWLRIAEVVSIREGMAQ